MRTPALIEFCEWVDRTAVSQSIQTIKEIVPTVQMVHILAIAVVMSSMFMVNLRVLGILGSDQSLARVFGRYRPAIWWSLPVLLVTGLVLITGEPMRSLGNWAFQLKMLLLVTVILLTLTFQAPIARDPGHWEATAGRRSAARAIAVLSLLLWTGILFAGRWIAYL